jgi:pimeloyl-ACP methyl ester carboxylesterase
MLSFFKASSPVNRLLFPAPNPPHYDNTTFASDTLVRIQHDSHSVELLPCLSVRVAGARVLLLYFHSNGEDLGDVHATLCASGDLDRWRASLVAVEYPGYGLAGGAASEESIDAASETAYRFAVRRAAAESLSCIVVAGRSIGCGPAIRLREQLGALITISAFTSLRDVAKGLTLGGALMFDRWNCIDAQHSISDVTVPTLFIHGGADTLIPPSHSRQLASRCPSGRLVVLPHATHNDGLDVSEPIETFLLSLGGAERNVGGLELLLPNESRGGANVVVVGAGPFLCLLFGASRATPQHPTRRAARAVYAISRAAHRACVAERRAGRVGRRRVCPRSQCANECARRRAHRAAGNAE